MIDTERVFAYRALRFARNDRTNLPGFEQDDYVAAAHFDRRPWADLLEEFEAVRRSNLLMFRGFGEEAWPRQGVANGNAMSVRAAAYVIAGHELHHMTGAPRTSTAVMKRRPAGRRMINYCQQVKTGACNCPAAFL